MLEKLLNSKTRVKVLTLFFKHERQTLYAQEIIKLVKSDAANVHRELIKLTKLGVLRPQAKNGRKYYQLNSRSPFYKGLKELTSSSCQLPTINTSLKHINDGDPWFMGEDIPDMDLFFSQIWLSGFANEFERHVGRMYRKVMSVHDGYHLWFYYGEKDSSQVGQHIVDTMIKHPDFAVRVNREIIKSSDKLRAFAETIPDSNLHKLSDAKLWKLYETHDRIHTEYYEWGWIPVAADMFHNNLTVAFTDYLRKKKVPAEKVNQYFTILTQPTSQSLIQQEEEGFLKIAQKVQADQYHRKLFKNLYRVFTEQEASQQGLAPHTPAYENTLEEKAQSIRRLIKPVIIKQVEKHYEQYFYMKHMWIGKDGVYTFEHYLKELVKFIGRNSDAASLLNERREEFEVTTTRRNALLKKLVIAGDWRTLFDAFGNFMVTKIYRRFAQIYAVYRMQSVLEEIASRLKISKMQMRFMLTKEVGEALLKKKINRQELAERTKFCVYYVERNTEVIFTGDEARRLAETAKPNVADNIEEFTGQIGCMGKAKGIVRIVIRPSDMAKMKEGDVLVSIATDPDIVPAMKKAAAIVTEQGGVTSHAAIVSRELNIPCVIGTKIATKVLKDGDLVEVDAERGIVRKLSLTARSPALNGAGANKGIVKLLKKAS